MMQHMDGRAVAAQVRMERQMHRRRSFIVLEGSNDIKAIKNVIDSEECELVNGYNKQNVIDAINELEEGGTIGVCGIIDSDYDEVLGVTYESEHILPTGYHDLDLLIFFSPALDKYLSVMADEVLLRKAAASADGNIRNLIIQPARILGAYRLASEKEGLSIYFKDMELHELVNDEQLTIKDHIHEYLVNRSHHPKCGAAQLKAKLDRILAEAVDDTVLCQGHDVATILGIALRKVLSNRKVQQTWGPEIEKGMRLAFDRDAFRKTELCAHMYKWQRGGRWRLLPTDLHPADQQGI